LFRRNAPGKTAAVEFGPDRKLIRKSATSYRPPGQGRTAMAIDADDNVWICGAMARPFNCKLGPEGNFLMNPDPRRDYKKGD